MNDHGIGSSTQKVRQIFPWDMYAATSENFSKFWEASINVTVGAPRLTDEVWDQCHYDGRTFVQDFNLTKIDFLYHTFPPHKKYSIGANGKYNFHVDDPRLWKAPTTVDANGHEVFTGDKGSFVHVKGVCGVGKTHNNLYLIAHALAASRGFNNDYFNMLDSPAPSIDKKLLIVLPNLRLAQRCFENLAKQCHSQEMYPPPPTQPGDGGALTYVCRLNLTGGVSVFYYDLQFVNVGGVWVLPADLDESHPHHNPDNSHLYVDTPCVVSHEMLKQHISVEQARIVFVLINAAPHRFPFVKHVRQPDGMYKHLQLQLCTVYFMEWYWICKAMINAEFLSTAHTSPAMIVPPPPPTTQPGPQGP